MEKWKRNGTEEDRERERERATDRWESRCCTFIRRCGRPNRFIRKSSGAAQHDDDANEWGHQLTPLWKIRTSFPPPPLFIYLFFISFFILFFLFLIKSIGRRIRSTAAFFSTPTFFCGCCCCCCCCCWARPNRGRTLIIKERDGMLFRCSPAGVEMGITSRSCALAFNVAWYDHFDDYWT